MAMELRPVATDQGIEGLAEIAQQALSVDYMRARGAIADAQRALKRIIARTQANPDKRWEINVSRGPRLEFTGNLLCETSFTSKSRETLYIEFSIYQTLAGALVATITTIPSGDYSRETLKALVVDPIDDGQAMRFAVMDFFEWSQGARSMVDKQLGWSLRRDVP